MNKKQIKQIILFFAGYNWFLSIGMIIMCATVWHFLDSAMRTLVTLLAVTVILEVPLWIYEIWKLIKRRRAAKSFCDSYADAINFTKEVHEQRYRCYLADDTKNIEVCAEMIQKNVPELIECAKKMEAVDIFSKNQKQQIQEGIEELQYLLNNVIPKNRTL